MALTYNPRSGEDFPTTARCCAHHDTQWTWFFCDHCHGEGEVEDVPCRICNGTGGGFACIQCVEEVEADMAVDEIVDELT